MNLLASLRLAAILFAAAGTFLYCHTSELAQRDHLWVRANIDEINRLALADGIFQRELLNSRAGLSRDYDALTRASAATQRSATALARLARRNAPLEAHAGRLTSLIDQRALLGERFKTDNALLQNSLARFTMISTDKRQSPATSALAAQILDLTLDTSPEAVRAAATGVSRLNRESGGTAPLLAHARLLVRLLPEADAILAQVRQTPIDEPLRAVRQAISEEAAADLSTLHLLWAAIVASWAATLALMAVMFGRLRFRARDLGRVAANERLNAHVSNLLIDTREGELGDRMTRALRMLANRVGAERACLCWSAASAPSFVWNGRGARYSTAWTELLRSAALQWPDARETVLFRSSAERRDDALAAAMRREDIASLLVVRTFHPLAATLVFCGGRERMKARPDVMAGLSLAFASMLQAVRHSRWERERHRLEQRLFQARRMETIGAVASGVAHNFNNILGAITGFSEIAEIHNRGNAVVGRNLAEIRSAVERAGALVDDMISFGRRSPAARQIFALETLVEETARLVRAAMPEGTGLVVRTANADAQIFGQEARLQQVMMNICKNAISASSEGQVVTMTLARRSLADSTVFSHATLDQGDYAVIAIEDSGSGISPSALPRIFEPFFTTRHEGTGLGLSTAWEIVQEHGGTIDVLSEPGRVTRFSIWLPQADPGAIEDSGDRDHASGHGERILIVTEPRNLMRDEELVASLGYEPVGVTDVAATPWSSALPFDAIVIASPTRRRLAALHRRAPGVPIVASFGGPGSTRHGQIAASLAYPFQRDELAQILSHCLHQAFERSADERGQGQRISGVAQPASY